MHGIISRGILLLTYRGRRSGKTYTIPVSYVGDNGDLLVVSLQKRLWWRNLAGGAPVSYRLRGRVYQGKAEVESGNHEKFEADLSTYLKEMRDLARRLGVTFDENGEPDPDSVRQVAENRVMVRIIDSPRNIL